MRTPTTQSLRGRRPSPMTAAVTDSALGTAIRARRVELGLHQDTLAERAGIDRAVLSRLERGERPCRLTEFVAIAEALNMGPATLLKQAFGKKKETAA